MRYTGFFPSCPPPLLRGVRGDSSCLFPIPCSLFPISPSPHLPTLPRPSHTSHTSQKFPVGIAKIVYRSSSAATRKSEV
ncbi:MAG: hypothetical protein F6J90_04865 [Moorea sp. SIOASIH]|uniref:hypothetical protein n=1 Tax=Moorena sp. SIOASIH TaxID=2607817 RepID=UPI0013B7EE4E|nr:hypothetical protein [Moorena sp. SIOASIH]NEO35687.1 hypothetical protein [Moorena sp. SIOASIH]